VLFVSSTSASIASRPAFVTIASRPSLGRDGAGCRFDLGHSGTEIFLQTGLDSPNHIDRVQELGRVRKRRSPGSWGGLGEAVIRRRNKMADYALAHPPYALPLLPFLRDEAGSSSWPGLSRPSTSFSPPESKTWMPGTSARSKASSPRPGVTEKFKKLGCARKGRSPWFVAGLGEAVIQTKAKTADYAVANPSFLRLLSFLRDDAGSSSWPSLSGHPRPLAPRKQDVDAPDIGAKQSFSPRPGMTEKAQEIRARAQTA
jgi:hypothetical protein